MRIVMAAAALLFAVPTLAEVPGEDHPLLPRYPGAEIRGYRAPTLDEVVIPTERIGDAKVAAAARPLEGKVTHIDYAVTPGVGTLGVARYYEKVLTDAGFRTVFACSGESACGPGMGELIFLSGKVAPTGLADGLFGDRMRVIVAQRGADRVLLHIYEGPDRTTIYEAVVEGAH